jgi:hypothetical protein
VLEPPCPGAVAHPYMAFASAASALAAGHDEASTVLEASSSDHHSMGKAGCCSIPNSHWGLEATESGTHEGSVATTPVLDVAGQAR